MEKRYFIPIFFSEFASFKTLANWTQLSQERKRETREKCDVFTIVMFLIGEEESARKMTSLLINGAC